MSKSNPSKTNNDEHARFAVISVLSIPVGFVLYFVVKFVTLMIFHESAEGDSWLSVVFLPLVFLLATAYVLAIIAIVMFIGCYTASYLTQSVKNSRIVRFVVIALLVLLFSVYIKSGLHYEDFVLAAFIGPLVIAGIGMSAQFSSRFKL